MIDLLVFVEKFFGFYKLFKKIFFFVVGELYGGRFVIELGVVFMEKINVGFFDINFKGKVLVNL